MDKGKTSGAKKEAMEIAGIRYTNPCDQRKTEDVRPDPILFLFRIFQTRSIPVIAVSV